MARLSVELTANIRRLEKELSDARKELATTGEAAERTAKKVAGTGQKGFRQLKAGAANATPTLQEFSRVIQDAPFGIQGVGNNITQLVSNFGNLQKATGGASAAFRLLLGSLAGPAGILFAISTVVSLLTVFGGRLRASKKEAEDLSKSLKNASDQYKTILELNDSEANLLEAQGKSTEFIKQERIKILRAQIGSLKAVQEQNQALLAQIRLQNETITLWEGLEGLLKKGVNNVINDIKRDVGFLLTVARSSAEITAQNLGLTKALSSFVEENKEAKEREKELTDLINQGQSNINNLLAEALNIEKGITKEKEKQTELTPGLTRSGPQARAAGATAGLTNAGIPGAGVLTTFQNDISVAGARAVLFGQQISQVFQQTIPNALGDFAFAIGNALAQGTNALQAGGKALLGGFGSILNSLGDIAIQTGLGVEAIKNALTSLGGLGAIAVGVALKAFAGTISGAVGGLTTRGFGSGVSGQGSGSFSGSVTTFSGAGGSGGTVVFEIQGKKLVGVLNNTLRGDRKTVSDLL